MEALPLVTPVPANDLHQGVSGHAPMARAERLLKTRGRRPSERDYLAALLAPSVWSTGSARHTLWCTSRPPTWREPTGG